jgi:hypothetical protein
MTDRGHTYWRSSTSSWWIWHLNQRYTRVCKWVWRHRWIAASNNYSGTPRWGPWRALGINHHLYWRFKVQRFGGNILLDCFGSILSDWNWLMECPIKWMACYFVPENPWDNYRRTCIWYNSDVEYNPSHVDIQRNKRTDVLAKEMSISGTLF